MQRLPALSLVLATCLLAFSARVTAQHARVDEAKPEAAKPAANKDAGETKSDAKAEAAADPDVATPKPTVKAKPAAPKPASKTGPDVKTVVERIQKRIDEELGPARAQKPPSVRTPAPRSVVGAQTIPVQPSPRRVRLTWRAELVWPDELAQLPAPVPASVIWP